MNYSQEEMVTTNLDHDINSDPAPRKSNNEQNQKPNIIFILGDNHHYRTMGCGGHPFLKTPGMDNINVITAGTKPPNPSEILSSARFKTFLVEANNVYDFVFVDTPPILPVADAAEIAPLMDGVFLVYTVGKIGRGVLKRAKTNLDNVDANVSGVILNKVKPETGPEYFKYHSQHYYGPESDGVKPKRTVIRWLKKHRIPLTRGRLLKFGVLALALSLLAAGIYWQDLHLFAQDWLATIQQLLQTP